MVCENVTIQTMCACVRYRYADSELVRVVSVVSFPRLILSNPLLSSSAPINMYIYIYTTNLLPLASAQAVLTGENHS